MDVQLADLLKCPTRSQRMSDSQVAAWPRSKRVMKAMAYKEVTKEVACENIVLVAISTAWLALGAFADLIGAELI